MWTGKYGAKLQVAINSFVIKQLFVQLVKSAVQARQTLEIASPRQGYLLLPSPIILTGVQPKTFG